MADDWDYFGFDHLPRTILSSAANLSGPTSRRVRWLIIFDNIDSAQLIHRYLPPGSHGSIIVTTRDPDIARALSELPIEVPLFSRPESLQFLLQVVPDAEQSCSPEIDAIKAVASRLDDLPLALDIIRAYVQSAALSYCSFLRDYVDFDTKFLFQQERSASHSSYQYPLSTAWTMTFAGMRGDTKELIERLVLFDPDTIPLEVLLTSDRSAKLVTSPFVSIAF